MKNFYKTNLFSSVSEFVYFEPGRIYERFIANWAKTIFRFATAGLHVRLEATTFAEFPAAKLTFQKRLKQ